MDSLTINGVKYIKLEDEDERDNKQTTVDNILPNQKKVKTYGTREEVYNGLALKTRGNLMQDDISFEKNKYMSKKKQNIARELAKEKTLPVVKKTVKIFEKKIKDKS